jgi:hypothetical protein
MPEPPVCCLCGQPCEPWHAPPTGYGHNPWPLGTDPEGRCCNTCNDTRVIPARLGRTFGTAARAATDPDTNQEGT